MPFGIGRKKKGNGGQSEFNPRKDEISFVKVFLDERDIPMMEAKALILGNEQIPEDRRGPLSDWVRQFRADNPRPFGQERVQG